MPRSRRITPTALAVFALTMLALGLWWGGHPRAVPGPLRTVFLDEETRTLNAVLDTIESDYYRPVRREALVDRGLDGVVAQLDDRFSRYLDPEDYRRFQDSSHGRFSGVGMEVREAPRGLLVTRVFPRAPAARAGIRRGDEIVAVDGRRIAGQPTQVTTGLIRGRPGTPVTLTVDSPSARERDLRLRRERVSAPSVQAALRTAGRRRVAVVGLSSFTDGAHRQLRRAVDRQRARGASAIVLDLRGNGGGLLTEAIQVASVFIPEGTIVTTRGRTRPRRVYTATGAAIPRRVPVVVLVDRGSASASEIVAAAIQDRGRGRVIGTRTFGKGVFQEVKELPNGGALDITVGEYFTPRGRSLGGGGIRRGAGVRPNLEAADDPSTPADEALDAALRTLAAPRR